MLDLSLLIPCYCEAPHLRKSALTLVQLLSESKISYELIFVEDGSPDNTWECLQSLSTELDSLNVSHKLIRHEKNCGRGAAVKTAIRSASAPIAGFIDIDLENQPEAILPMYQALKQGDLDLIVGKRVNEKKYSRPLRHITHLGYKWLVHLIVSLPVSDTETGLKLFDREKILALLPMTKSDHWFWDTELVLVADKLGLRIGEHPVLFVRNKSKPSTVRVFRDSFLYLRALLHFISTT